MEIKGIDYRVTYAPETHTITMAGMLRLSGPAAYAPIADLLMSAIQQHPQVITLDVYALDYLNSSGINMLYQFAIATRQVGAMKLVVRGSKNQPWHRTLQNLSKFQSEFELILA